MYIWRNQNIIYDNIRRKIVPTLHYIYVVDQQQAGAEKKGIDLKWSHFLI